MLSKKHYDALREKWIKRHQDIQEKLWQNHQTALQWFVQYPKEFAIASAGSFLLLTSPVAGLLPSHTQTVNSAPPVKKIYTSALFEEDLQKILPSEVLPLTPDQENKITEIISAHVGFPVIAEIDGIRLNRNYGLIGQEQYLARYPGDTLDAHFDSPDEAAKFSSYGMAPGLGAWGYFASSAAAMTSEDVLREKYYIAVPTFLAPGFAENTGKYINFFKFRKMLLVNPDNGKAIMTDIGDAGPAEYTGKHLGGSPEVMHYLGRVDGAQKGPVLYFFVDDPNDTIPLGPIEIK